jgi:hypothetical protein
MRDETIRLDEDDWPEMVIVDDEDRVWDDELGHYRCPLGLIQAPRPILRCIEWNHGGFKLYVQQLEREGICDVAVSFEDEQELAIRAITCAYDHQRARHPRLIVMHHKWYDLPPLNGRRLYDAETDKELVVEHCKPAFPTQPGSLTASGVDTVLDLDIPF